MGAKKIMMKSSAKELIAKSAVTKKKALPKLKVILANPYKPKYEALVDSELSQFVDLISTEIKSSGTSGILFARQNNITLGLGASLRAIKNKKASCVLVSRSIKPKFIIDQIGSFTKQITDSVPVFVVDNLDTTCVNLFGIKALVVVFPSGISGKLGKWIAERTLHSKESQNTPKNVELDTPTLPKQHESPIDLSSIYLTKQSNGTRAFVPDVVFKPKETEEPEAKAWTGDFISFSNQNETDEDESMDMDEVDEEFRRKQDKVLETFEKIAKSKQQVEVEVEAKPKIELQKQPLVVNKKVPQDVDEEWENDSSYISLEVHKIQPNPNRKPKNKRKKKNKNKNKVS